jgi:catechol 2,3-dioxygenase-like lactoylglutathione lyase family enzyme
MLDHLSIGVTDLARSRAFYEGALAPLEYKVIFESSGVVGLGAADDTDFWITTERPAPGGQIHIAFAAADRSVVDAFHEAALAAGGEDNGGPGVREIYHPDYYGAFVLDPDGHNVEAVCHRPAD